MSRRPSTSLNVSRSTSFSTKTPPHLPSDISALDPDELFTKHTVAEVKLIRQRLRSDADAKQEELRLMVGERYRDLLQASTSIISIARSSKTVIQALEETKNAIVTQGQLPPPRRASQTGKNDAHLQTLQLLSAHVKLLLDTPEHLWRLIERKHYFSATWLFLLARVVHRSLVSDEQDEETWGSQGLNVLEQFPLIQRQWDAVSQFHSQIIHKATLSLREYETSAEDICATLLTLHLLDSRPLTDTLSVLLVQRSKALHLTLAWTSEQSSSTNSARFGFNRPQSNGHPPEKPKISDKKQTTFRRTPVREVKRATLTALDVIFRTVTAARKVFQQRSSMQHSMAGSALEYIQSDSPNFAPRSLPPVFRLNTETLLATLPSSTHFLLLPPNLRSYKPYVDLTSSSSSVPQVQLTQKLEEWFRKSSEHLESAVKRWFSDLQSVTEVWNIRSSVLKWIHSASELEEQETRCLVSVFDSTCRERLLGIWESALGDAEQAFGAQLTSVVSALASSDDSQIADTAPVEYLFQAPSLPTLSQNGVSSIVVDSSFQKYKSTLRLQIMGRNSLLNDVLSTLENCARSLQHDLSRIYSEDNDNSRVLVEEFRKGYRPHAGALCSGLIDILQAATKSCVGDTEGAIRSLVFVGRVADELASSSSFVLTLDCEECVVDGFRKKTGALRDWIVDHWRQHTVSKAVREHWHSFHPPLKAFPVTGPSGPSSSLIHSFLSLSICIQQLGIYREPSRQRQNAEQTLRLFITELNNGSHECWNLDGRQALSDLAILRNLASLWGQDWAKVSELVEDKICAIQGVFEDSTPDKDYLDSAAEFLSRTQTLFATLLPLPPPHLNASTETSEKSNALLPYGVPTLDQHFQPALQVVKPSSRFGLLLVGN